MEEKTIMTPEGFKKATERLNFLKSEKRQEVAKKLAEARSYGDLSENSEYDIAREEQSVLEAEIFDLENKLKNVEVVDPKTLSNKVVGVGSKVTVINTATNQVFDYKIVGDTDSDPLNGLISNNSPIGSGLIGKKVGEIASIKVPAGVINLKITKIKV